MDIDSPIFIIGNPRSGTSLLRLMLTNHPAISIAPECGLIQWWFDKYKRWSAKDARSEKKIAEYVKDLSSSKKIETWEINYERLKERIAREMPASYSCLSSMPYIEYASKQEKYVRYWGDKNNYYIHYLDFIFQLYPKAKFIFIVRDGRDVACSYKLVGKLETNSKFKPNLPQDIITIAKEWDGNHRKILHFSQNFTLQKHFIKYEDLVLNTQPELTKICDFLGLPFSKEMLDYYLLNRKEKTEPEALMAWKQKTLEKPDPSNIDKYKVLLTSNEIEIFNITAKKMLSHFGYE